MIQSKQEHLIYIVLACEQVGAETEPFPLRLAGKQDETRPTDHCRSDAAQAPFCVGKRQKRFLFSSPPHQVTNVPKEDYFLLRRQSTHWFVRHGQANDDLGGSLMPFAVQKDGCRRFALKYSKYHSNVE